LNRGKHGSRQSFWISQEQRMKEEIFDVVLQSTGDFLGSIDEWERFPPPNDDFFLETDF
jgi:hypothetical protein